MKTKMTLVALAVLVNAGCANQINAAIDDINSGIQSSLESLSGDDSASTASSAHNANTVYCDDKAVGDSFKLNGHTYLVVNNDTARNKSNLQKLEKGQIRYCTSHVTDMSYMLYGVYDYDSISDDYLTDVNVYDEIQKLKRNSFNQPIGDWDVSNVTSLNSLFFGANLFNQSIEHWDVSNVTNMAAVFQNAESFNQPLNNWDVSNVIDMSEMFWGAYKFNQSLNNWNVQDATDIEYMFEQTYNFDWNNIKSWSRVPEQ